jgi:hypothetical protein
MPFRGRSSPKNLRRVGRGLGVSGVCLCLLLPAGRLADAAQITVSYNTVQTQVRPRPGTWTTSVKVLLTLRGANQINDEVHSDNLAGHQRTWSRAGAFREKIGGPASSTRTAWHVEDKKTIIRTTDYDQQTLTVRVVMTSDAACSAQVVYRLKPGFKEYKLISIRRGTPLYLSAIRVENVLCQATP